MATLLIIFAAIFVLGPIAKAYADRLSRQLPPDAAAAVAELGRLREEVERLSLEVSRLQDAQSFMVRLLGEGDRRRLEKDQSTPE